LGAAKARGDRVGEGPLGGQAKPYLAAVRGRSVDPTKHAPFASNIRLEIKVDTQPRRWLKR
jgi:hypothetical protein